MKKRHFTLRDAWDTQTHEFQHKKSAKRTNVSTSGDTSVTVVRNQPKEEFVEKTLVTYLFKHLTLMVEHAKDESMPITQPSGSLPREVRGSDTASASLSPSTSYWRPTVHQRHGIWPKSCQPPFFITSLSFHVPSQ